MINTKKTLLLTAIILIIAGFAFFTFKKGFTGFVVREGDRVKLVFSDDNSNCSIDGLVLINNKIFTTTANSSFYIYQKDFESFQNNTNLSIFGKLGFLFLEN
jgi:hypothetical protein